MSAYGLFPAEQFAIATGEAAVEQLLPQARWYFRHETLAIPRPGLLAAGFARELPVWADLAAWAGANPLGSPPALPPLIWLGSPDVLRHAELAAAGALRLAGSGLAVQLVPRLPLNRSYFDPSSRAALSGQALKLRGHRRGDAFVARTLWPERFRLPERAPSRALAAEPAALRDWVRALPGGGAQAPFAVESIWRRPGSGGVRTGQTILGLMLNGAQGDDDEAYSGHFGVITGSVGEAGAIDDWLVNNFYTLDSESEKGIIAAPVPLDNYLADLNSGQAWYRPSVMLVATLRQPRTAAQLQGAFGRVYNQFYRHQFAYHHACANCAGISVSTARTLGWRVPARGAESWAKAIAGLPLAALREKSLRRGKLLFDYLTEDRTRLYPAVAFEEMGADLLRLAGGRAGRSLSEFERRLADDIDEILLVRVPQFPSSRAWGDYPAAGSVEYRARLPTDPARRQIVPVPPRPFPDELRDPLTPAEPPLRSDYAVAAWGSGVFAVILLILHRLLA